MRWVALAVVVGACGGGPAKVATPPVVGHTAVGPATQRATSLEFIDEQTGGVFFTLGGDGTLRIGDTVVGVMAADGRLTFSGMEGVSAVLGAGGRVTLEARNGTDLAGLPGEIGTLLRDYQGHMASAYVIDADGVATAERAPRLEFDERGKLVGTALSVPGLPKERRRTAMFIYVLLSMIIA